MRKDTERLVAELRRQRFTVSKGGQGHWKVRDPRGNWVTTLSASPSDHRSLRNATAQLRRHGFAAA